MQSRRRAGSTGVRIVGGRWRGRRLAVPDGTGVRPTPDRVRETLFNWLTPSLPGACCLDLFAGTGALGLEALSRGAARATFVERDAVLVRALDERIGALAAPARVFHGDALEFLAAQPQSRFDVVFVDPPYAMGLVQVLEELVAWLEPEHLVYVERPAERGGRPLDEALAAAPHARLVKQGGAARVAFGLLRLTSAE